MPKTENFFKKSNKIGNLPKKKKNHNEKNNRRTLFLKSHTIFMGSNEEASAKRRHLAFNSQMGISYDFDSRFDPKANCLSTCKLLFYDKLNDFIVCLKGLPSIFFTKFNISAAISRISN